VDFKNLFEQVKQFKKEQEKQKQRGLNNYNILTTVLKEHDEVRLHSRMIASFLNPSGEHYQSTLFLDKFLEVLNLKNFNIDSKTCSVYREYKNIDLYITDGDKHIIIENKIYAGDQKKQIERYVERIKEENNDLECNNILVIYLSLKRDKPKEHSLGSLSIENGFLKREKDEIALFKSIYYKNEILEWLEKCQYEIQNITNLNEVFRQYIDVVKMINNQYEDKIMNFSDYIKDNKSIYKLAVEIEKELPKVREKIINNFFEKIKNSLEKTLNHTSQEWIIEVKNTSPTKYVIPLIIYKKNWNEKNMLKFDFEFGKQNYYSGYIGVHRNNNSIDIQKEIIEKFDLELKKLSPLNTTEKWLHHEFLSETYDFPNYIMFKQNAEEKFIDGIMNLIKIFEIDSNLITKINAYLNSKNK